MFIKIISLANNLINSQIRLINSAKTFDEKVKKSLIDFCDEQLSQPEQETIDLKDATGRAYAQSTKAERNAYISFKAFLTSHKRNQDDVFQYLLVEFKNAKSCSSAEHKHHVRSKFEKFNPDPTKDPLMKKFEAIGRGIAYSNLLRAFDKAYPGKYKLPEGLYVPLEIKRD